MRAVREVVLRRAPAYLFQGLGLPRLDPDHLAIRIQPDEGMSLAFHVKEPGPGITLQTVKMDFAYQGRSRRARPRPTSASCTTP